MDPLVPTTVIVLGDVPFVAELGVDAPPQPFSPQTIDAPIAAMPSTSNKRGQRPARLRTAPAPINGNSRNPKAIDFNSCPVWTGRFAAACSGT